MFTDFDPNAPIPVPAPLVMDSPRTETVPVPAPLVADSPRQDAVVVPAPLAAPSPREVQTVAVASPTELAETGVTFEPLVAVALIVAGVALVIKSKLRPA